MSEEKTGDTITANITGTVSGQVAVGKQITQTQTVGTPGEVTQADLDALREAMAALRAQVEAAAPLEKKEAALERVGELEEAVTAEEPDLDTMGGVRRWFVKNLPGLAAAVTGILVHPVVGKLVGAAGEVLAQEYQRRFGEA